MIRRLSLAASLLALAGCVTPSEQLPLPPDAAHGAGYVDPADVERIVLDAARERYGDNLVSQSVRSSDYIIVWRAYGGIPVPPPPGEPFPPPPAPRMALLAMKGGLWVFAENGIWRQARPGMIAEIEAIAATQNFWQEPVHVPPCPDYGAMRMVAKFSGKPKIARDHACPSQSDRLAHYALEA